MTNFREMRLAIEKQEQEMHKAQENAINSIINELYDHPIAMDDTHYEFLKKIEKELRQYKKDFLA